MHLIKAIIILICSCPLLAFELEERFAPPQSEPINYGALETPYSELADYGSLEAPHSDQANDVKKLLLSISHSLENITKTTVKLNEAANSITDNKAKESYIQLQSQILESSLAINNAIASHSGVNIQHTSTSSKSDTLEKRVDELYLQSDYFSYADFAAISITSVSVLITVLAIFMAILSFLGWRNIRNTTKATTKKIAENVAKDTTNNQIDTVVKVKLEELLDEGKFNSHLERVVDSLILRNKNGNNNINWEELDKNISWDELGAGTNCDDDSEEQIEEKEQDKK